MLRRLFLLSLVFGTILAVTATDRPALKQLAGPIEEIRHGVMAPVDPTETALRSGSAMIPVTLNRNAAGEWVWRGDLAIDSAHFDLVFFDNSRDWSLSLVQPGAKRVQPIGELSSDHRWTEFGIGEDRFPGDAYRFEDMTPGVWSLDIRTDDVRGHQGYLIYGTDSPYRLLSFRATEGQLVGNPINFVGYGFAADGLAMPEAIGDLVQEAWLQVTTPSGEHLRVDMADDGLHGDQGAGDGVFGIDFVPSEAGAFLVQVVARGITPEGLPFLRTAEHTLSVITADVTIAGEVASAYPTDEKRLHIALPVDDFGITEKVRVSAEVWGTRNGEMVPANWIGGMAYVEHGAVSLGLDTRWLSRAMVTAPFELRSVRVEDVDTFVPMDTRERIRLITPENLVPTRFSGKMIDAEMRMGPRPERPRSKAGARLLLVHGYCSGNAWGPVSGQFSNASVFQDFNQNRSHDQFANRIINFGSSYSSYGIVAHSQGGAAALHLYTYYWSGLDYASGNRLIQSVGTPYQGTSLAGNIAALGSIFGAGCGANNDLTYSGASSWLSGVPSWARAEVTYFTTSFEDRWWAYDYCHLASDLVLSDPDDGTTEKAKGQLSGANNGGHKTGWCHTSGMRDPSQVTDSSRNASMNSNAAR